MLRDGGQCGIVIPSGIYTDLGAKQLRIMLFEECGIDSLFCIENRLGVFEDVHRMFKFVVLTFAHGGKTAEFPAAFMRHEVSELERFPGEGSLPISVELVKKLSPDSLSVMEFKTPLDVQIAEKMLRFPLLGDDIEGKWTLRLTAEFHMTNDSDLFETKPGPVGLPLYEGKMIWHYDHRFAEPRYWVNEKAARLVSPRAASRRRVSESLGSASVMSPQIQTSGRPSPRSFRLSISSATRYLWRFRTPPTHPLRLELLPLVAVFNSLVFDWLIRQKITNHLNMFYVYQMPCATNVPQRCGFCAATY